MNHSMASIVEVLVVAGRGGCRVLHCLSQRNTKFIRIAFLLGWSESGPLPDHRHWSKHLELKPDIHLLCMALLEGADIVSRIK